MCQRLSFKQNTRQLQHLADMSEALNKEIHNLILQLIFYEARKYESIKRRHLIKKSITVTYNNNSTPTYMTFSSSTRMSQLCAAHDSVCIQHMRVTVCNRDLHMNIHQVAKALTAKVATS